MTFCERLQQFLVEKGAAALKDDAEAQQHLVDCSECFDFIEALEQVDVTLARMPEHDAPDALVQRTLAAVTGAAAPSAAPAPATTPATTEEPKPSRFRRVLGWLRRGLGWLWSILSFAWLRRRLAARTKMAAPQTEQPRWRRILTSPKFLIPATAAPSLLLLLSTMVVLTTGRDAPMSAEIADSGMMPAPTQPSSGDYADDVVTMKKRARKQADVREKFGKMFEDSGGGEGSVLGGGGGGSLNGSLSEVIGTTGRGDSSGIGTGRLGGSDTLGTLSGNEVGEATGAAGLGLRGPAGVRSKSEPSGPPSDAPARQAVPEMAQQFAASPVVLEPEPVATPQPKPSLDPGALSRAPEKPRERSRDDESVGHDRSEDQLKNLLPASGVKKDQLDELRKRRSHSERDKQRVITKREEKRASGESDFKNKGKLNLESKPSGAAAAFDLEVDEDEISEEEAWADTDIAKAPDESRHKGTEGKSGKRDSGRFGYLAVDSPNTQGAEVIIDGRVTGNAPMVTEVAPGLHRIQLRADGFEDKEVSVTVTTENDRRNPANVNIALTSEIAKDFLAERSRTDGLRFKSPDGYWANTYVPGDPAMRLLASRLDRVDRTMLGALRLDQSARQYAQPFDAPTTSALDVYLHADKAGIQHETRMLVQVGIKGTPRRSRSRPTMNVGVVLDLSDTPATEQQNAMRALVMALGDARDIGDRFSLVVAGRPGGLVVAADAFKHGPLAVAMRSLLANESSGETLSLRQATERAIGIVIGKDDPTTPLGSSVVVVVTPNRIDPYELNRLTDMAHESAVNGVPISVVGVGGNVSMEQLDQLTLAGQGNRRLLTSPSEAEGLVDRELSSVSRVIARAVRVRIRLAPGVKLIDVIGSHRLDEERAEQVRQAEQSIDRRMSRNLGVVSDRGEDEDGVQIVIPSYYAGDTHVILLDVVAPGPGPIADVRVRYKDLVYLKNGVSRANLTLHRSPLRAGPLEHNVLKNFLARNVSAGLEHAGDLLDGGDANGAREHLLEQLELLVGLMQEMPALASDRDLLTDISMLGEYSSILTTVAHGQPRDYVIDSLRYAAFLKVLPRPAED